MNAIHTKRPHARRASRSQDGYEDLWPALRTGNTRRGSGFVYFIESPRTQTWKIGFTVDIKRRLEGIQTSNCVPVFLRLSVPGCGADELYIHYHLRAHRSHGEWFNAHPDINETIQILATHGLDRTKLRTPSCITGEQCRNLRIKLGWTVCHLARAASTGAAQITSLERGLTFPSIPVVDRVEKVFRDAGVLV